MILRRRGRPWKTFFADEWKYEVKYWPVRFVCAMFGHQNLGSARHWEICEYNYGSMEFHQEHAKGGSIGRLIESWCFYCDGGHFKTIDPLKPSGKRT